MRGSQRVRNNIPDLAYSPYLINPMSLSPMKILRKMQYRVRTGRLDEDLVGLVEKHLDDCWQAATVV
jgi:hypothetical protein